MRNLLELDLEAAHPGTYLWHTKSALDSKLGILDQRLQTACIELSDDAAQLRTDVNKIAQELCDMRRAVQELSTQIATLQSSVVMTVKYE